MPRLRHTARPSLLALEARRTPATVTTSADEDDYETDPNWKKDHPDDFRGPDGMESLHEAILEVNKHGGSITFDVSTVNVTDTSNPLPPITKHVTITGKTGGGGAPGTIISGSGGGTTGLVLSAGGDVTNLVINSMGGSGLELDAGGMVSNCYIGTSATGEFPMGNSGEGIAVFGPGVTVKNCVVSGNSGDGIGIDGNNVSGVKVQGCMIGVDVDGQNPIPNGYGVFIGSGAHNNLVGGTSEADRNIISGNTKDGVVIGESQNSPRNTVAGNYIGVGADGTTKIANGVNGVNIHGSSSNTIGGTAPGARNIIAGNGDTGVNLGAFTGGFGGPTPSNGNKVLGNYLGVDVAGALLKNMTNGVNIGAGSDRNIIGGPTAAARNIVAGAGATGVIVEGHHNTVIGNYIGTGIHGSETGYGNNTGVLCETADNTIGGTSAADRNIIAGNNGVGVSLAGVRDTVEGNWIGLDSGGNLLANKGDGVDITAGSENKVLKNVLASDQGSLVKIGGGSKHVVAGNLLGLSPDGSVLLGHVGFGVDFQNGSECRIGGTKASDRNVIAGAGSAGVIIFAGNNNTIEGNYIGAGKSGAATGFGNEGGIEITGSASGNTIGGPSAGDRNVISGNNNYGIVLLSGPTTVQGNYIGTNAAGTAKLPNQGSGIEESGTSDIILNNVISGNGADGIGPFAGGGSGASIRGNKIGTDKTGKKAIPNGGSGIHLQGGSNDIVGGLKSGDSNVIAFNAGTGITFDGGTGNLVEGNSIFSNGGLGISLVNGANGNQAPPTFTSATRSGSKITVKGTVAGAASTSVILELYASKADDPSGAGEGEDFLGEVTATTDANGNFTAVFTKAPPAGAHVLSMTVRFNNGTSAFSTNKTI
jgi:hypothetical protein